MRCSLITGPLLLITTLHTGTVLYRIEILFISSMPICTYHPVVMLLMMNQISSITKILLPVVEHTHRYRQFLFRLIFAFVIALNIAFSALLWFSRIPNVSPLHMDFSLLNIPNGLVEHANIAKITFKIISFVTQHHGVSYFIIF